MKLLRIVENFGGGGNPSLGLDLTRFWGVAESEKKNKPSFFSAFTLAEMMVVMLILSIVLAAMAPVMTTRNKPNNSSPWKYQANNRNNAWFGAGSAQHAMIGQNSYGANDTVAKLLIKVGDDTTNFLAFKHNDANIGRLFIGGTNLLLGNLASGTLGDGSVVVGRNLQAGTNSTGLGSTVVASGSSSTAVGSTVTASGANSTGLGSTVVASGSSSTAVGSTVTASGASSLAVGTSSNATADNSLAIGNAATGSGENSISLGASSNATATNSIAIGNNAKAENRSTLILSSGVIAIGNAATGSGENSIAIGQSSTGSADNSIAIGNTAIGSYSNSIAIGNTATGSNSGSIAIGRTATGSGDDSIAIGSGATGSNSDSIAIGTAATGSGFDPIAIGHVATASGSGSIALGYKATGSNFDSIAIGARATANDSRSIAIGYTASATETEAVAVGYSAEASGNFSIAIGENAKTYGERSVVIGNNITNMEADIIQLGNAFHTVYIPGNLIVGRKCFLGANITGSDVAVAGHWGNKGKRAWIGDRDGNNAFDIYLPKGEGYAGPGYDGAFNFITKSDRRLKYVGKENKSGLDKICQLKVFNYTFKKDTTKTPHVGVIAQDLQKVFPNAVKKGADGFLTIRMEDMFYAVINAIKELDAKYQAQEKRITAIEKENKELKARLDRLEAKVK